MLNAIMLYIFINIMLSLGYIYLFLILFFKFNIKYGHDINYNRLYYSDYSGTWFA